MRHRFYYRGAFITYWRRRRFIRRPPQPLIKKSCNLFKHSLVINEFLLDRRSRHSKRYLEASEGKISRRQIVVTPKTLSYSTRFRLEIKYMPH